MDLSGLRRTYLRSRLCRGKAALRCCRTTPRSFRWQRGSRPSWRWACSHMCWPIYCWLDLERQRANIKTQPHMSNVYDGGHHWKWARNDLIWLVLHAAGARLLLIAPTGLLQLLKRRAPITSRQSRVEVHDSGIWQDPRTHSFVFPPSSKADMLQIY